MNGRAGDGQARRRLIDLSMLTALGLVMAVLGPFGSIAEPVALRYAYWLLAIVGGGAIGITIDALLVVRLPDWRRRLSVVTLAMTPPVTGYIAVLNAAMIGAPETRIATVWLAWQVLVMSLLVMGTRALAWRRPPVPPAIVEERIVIAPPLPEAETRFRQRLSARTRSTRLIAVEAHDHYCRVHTAAGIELVTARFADVVEELAGAWGYRTHRSWWVAGDAIVNVRWSRGVGEARLVNGSTAPVSRSQASTLREAGW